MFQLPKLLTHRPSTQAVLAATLLALAYPCQTRAGAQLDDHTPTRETSARGSHTDAVPSSPHSSQNAQLARVTTTLASYQADLSALRNGLSPKAPAKLQGEARKVLLGLARTMEPHAFLGLWEELRTFANRSELENNLGSLVLPEVARKISSPEDAIRFADKARGTVSEPAALSFMKQWLSENPNPREQAVIFDAEKRRKTLQGAIVGSMVLALCSIAWQIRRGDTIPYKFRDLLFLNSAGYLLVVPSAVHGVLFHSTLTPNLFAVVSSSSTFKSALWASLLGIIPAIWLGKTLTKRQYLKRVKAGKVPVTGYTFACSEKLKRGL